jgi:hypothetical protein
MKSFRFSFKVTIALIAISLFYNTSFAQLNGFVLTPSGETEDYMKYIRNAINVDDVNYFTGYLSLSAYKNYNTGILYDPGTPLQKLQLRGGNILLYGTDPYTNINPTSKNGAILFSDNLSVQYPHGKWGIEYDDMYSTGGLNFFKPKSSLTDTRINFNLFLANNGNVGIGTGEPKAKLQVTDGDIYIENIDRGIIMKSPDGKCWRGTLNNQGQLAFAELPDCIITDNKNAEPTKISTVSVFPNPGNEKLNISLGKFSSGKSEIKVISASGLILMTIQQPVAKTTDINIGNLETGTYILQVTNGKEMESVTFIKQ